MSEQVQFTVFLGKAWVTVTQKLEEVGDALDGFRVRENRLSVDVPAYSLDKFLKSSRAKNLHSEVVADIQRMLRQLSTTSNSLPKNVTRGVLPQRQKPCVLVLACLKDLWERFWKHLLRK